jgi:(S)-2-hydroxyglutarate dehydrogenase
MYEFAILGGGIVGLSTGMALANYYPNARIVVIEKENHWAFHQSGHNSGVIHSGIYYKPGSLKAKLCREGSRSMVSFCREHEIDYEVCGKVIVASNPKELPLLDSLYRRGLENGLNVKKVDSREVSEIEPHVSCVAGIHVPSTAITDYRQVCRKFADLILSRGGRLELNTRVEKISNSGNVQVIETNNGTFDAGFVVNCTGLHSDRVAKMGHVDPHVRIIPFRGEYYELKPEKRYLVKNLVYPVPDPDFPFLGVHFTRMVDGSIHAGPNAVLSLKREGYKNTDFNLRDFAEIISYKGFWKLAARHAGQGIQEIIRSFSKAAFVRSLQKLIPEIDADDLIRTQAGIRAQAVLNNGKLVDDFLIVKGKNAVHVCNAPSPAATSSIAIGKAIVEQIARVTG